jgi:aspyridone synthetase trans-acting enoyl reductase
MTSTSSLPPTQTALVAQAQGRYTIFQHHALPKLPPATHDIIVCVSHVALNPCNWKMIDFSPAVGAVGGNDFSGTVVAVGNSVKRWQEGDVVCGFLYGLDPNTGPGGWAGAFAHYVSVDEGLVMRVASSMNEAEAAGLGAGVVTAGMALFRSLNLPSIDVAWVVDGSGGGTTQRAADKKKPYILIYGGSTATGTMAIQLARL